MESITQVQPNTGQDEAVEDEGNEDEDPYNVSVPISQICRRVSNSSVTLAMQDFQPNA